MPSCARVTGPFDRASVTRTAYAGAMWPVISSTVSQPIRRASSVVVAGGGAARAADNQGDDAARKVLVHPGQPLDLDVNTGLLTDLATTSPVAAMCPQCRVKTIYG